MLKGNIGMVASVKEEGEVERQLINAKNAVVSIQDRVDKLSSRITMVLKPATETLKSVNKPSDCVTTVPLAMEIQIEILGSLETIIERLEDLTDRVSI